MRPDAHSLWPSLLKCDSFLCYAHSCMAALLNVHTVKIGTHVEPEGGGSPHPRALGGNPSFSSFRELDIFATPERDHILYVGLELLQGGTPTKSYIRKLFVSSSLHASMHLILEKQLIPIYSLDDKCSESSRFSASCSKNIISFFQPGQACPPETKTHNANTLMLS